MAEITVNLVLGKLADAVVQEALSLYGVREKVGQIERQLKWIQAFLKDADTKRHKDERVKQWVKEVREVGDLIEDVLDKFLEEVGGGKPEGLANVLKGIGKMPMKLFSKHKLGSEIDKINQRICEITENRKKYGIEELKETSSTGASVMLPIRPFFHPDIDETEVVGFEVDKKTIVDQLIDTNKMRRDVISIVGAGGSGKTTLAKEVYKSAEVKRHFDISMWLTISQEYKLMDILIKMLEKIRKVHDSERQNKEEEYFITELNKSMKERKYLIVLDDVWSINVWTDQLQAALPNANNGSRVLITTRFINIPEEIDRISKPHVIQPLNEEESKQLLLKKVFPNQFANECPNNLLPLTTEFTKICRGWPLPLVVLGGILSRKNPDHITWDEVMQKMDWQTDGRIFMGVISTSYEDLPIALKPCFMYFGVFPEDYQIKATTLIQLWIAEGFIRQEGSKSLEDIAEGYLDELVQRCMVQVSKRSYIGKIKYCHIHDLLRDLAVQKAKESNFLTVVSKNDTNLSCSTCARRVALHGYGNKMIEQACKKNIRSLINFEDVPNFNKFGTLRVLHMGTVSREYFNGTNCLKGLNALTALKYYGLEGDHNWFSIKCNFPTVRFFKRSPLTYMKNLQTVHTWFCKSHGELPPSFWGNKQLRHINLSCCWNHHQQQTPEGPPSAADLQSLLTLKGVRARQDWVIELPKFPYLRKLGIDIPEDVAGEPLINSLSNLNHLGSLYLYMEGGNCRMTFPDCISAFRNHNHLYSFSLEWGRWPRKEIGDCTLFPPHLVKLTLWRFSFEEDPMPQLEKLPNLKVLNLYGKIDATDGKQMICSRGGFDRLQRLQLYVRYLEEWKIEEGAMPMLNQLQMASNWMQIVPDLQYLVNLQELTVDCLDEFKARLEGEDQWKIKHIPSVKISVKIH
ncbi:disease resistance protein RPP13-like [Carex rostrata]